MSLSTDRDMLQTADKPMARYGCARMTVNKALSG
jgi:DNA-binding GntR family transcriptional regulator